MPADPLRALLRELAADDAAELVEQTRAAGRDEAARILRERWRDAYLEAAAEPRRPPAADATAWWVYGIVEAGAPHLPEQLRGVAGAAVGAVASGPLAAVVSEVPLAEFGDEQLRRHLEDLEWVERTARAHEHVLEAVMATQAIVPLRLCTIYLSRDRAAALLDEQRESLVHSLEALHGRSEWGVKLWAHATAEPASDAPDADPQAYLERKRNARDRREHAHREGAERAQHVHETIAQLAVAAVANPPQRREAHGRDADMVLNGAYLVDDARREELAAAVAQLQAQCAPYEVELTGPWPAYNFSAPAAGAIS